MNSYEENIIIMNEQRDRMNRQRELPLRLSHLIRLRSVDDEQ